MSSYKDELLADLIAFASEATAMPVGEIGPRDSLESIGVDSAAVIALSAHLEEQFGVIADSNDLPRDVTIEQIADLVIRKQKDQACESG